MCDNNGEDLAAIHRPRDNELEPRTAPATPSYVTYLRYLAGIVAIAALITVVIL